MRIGKKMERRMAAYQQDLMEKHCEEVENMYARPGDGGMIIAIIYRP